MKKEILLNCMPPASVNAPSPALSILKSHLSRSGYSVRVIYWNVLFKDLQSDFIWSKTGEDEQMLLYAAYLAKKKKNTIVYNEVKTTLMHLAPIMLNESKTFYDDHIENFVTRLDVLVLHVLDNIDFSNVLYFGFSLKMDQWILAAAIADRIKHISSNVPIVVGGINTPSVAKHFLDTFSQFDFAIWGEGERPLELLSSFISKGNYRDVNNFNGINTYYRDQDCSIRTMKNDVHINLSITNFYPDYSDFFEQIPDKQSQSIVMFIEGGRGCHWNRCHFCYLNYGYKHRLKSVDKILEEIRYMLKCYSIYKFEFLDNDLIGNDIKRFHLLLHELISLRSEYPEFGIVAVEIITKGLDYETIKLMEAAGIKAIQIGYESASDSLLKKIDKKNSFASNINCIKHCMKVGIRISGANVIYNLIEETEEDIQESIANLRFFRFILNSENPFAHVLIPLMVNSSSKYYARVSENNSHYSPYLLPHHKIYFPTCDPIAKWSLFEYMIQSKNDFWRYFIDIQYYFIKNKFTYSFCFEAGMVFYKEFFNGDIIETISFEKNDISLAILKSSYNAVVSREELISLICGQFEQFDNCTIDSHLDFLFDKGLIYKTPCNSEISSIVYPDIS